ncbi:MAG: ATP-binding cassette domain-containing protein, partial [Clostridia bacterium]
GLEGYGDYFPGQLSVGMQQRVAVARALMIEPDVLVMDEPFSALDELTALKLRDELLALWSETGCTVLFVTHNPLEAVYLADRVAVMSPGPGRIVGELDVTAHVGRPREADDPAVWRLSRQAVALLRSTERS